MISPSILVHVEGIWKEVFVIVMDWASIDGLSELTEDYLYGRTGQDVFSMEDKCEEVISAGVTKGCGISTATRREGENRTGRTQAGEISKVHVKNYNAYFCFKLYLL
jgi:hypothetical protein